MPFKLLHDLLTSVVEQQDTSHWSELAAITFGDGQHQAAAKEASFRAADILVAFTLRFTC
jgi:hypothetical protein